MVIGIRPEDRAKTGDFAEFLQDDAGKPIKPGFEVPLYGVPTLLKARTPWYSREEISKLPAAHAALTDQTDGWASLTLTGPHATDALLRLVPLDLRPAAFPVVALTSSEKGLGLPELRAEIMRTTGVTL